MEYDPMLSPTDKGSPLFYDQLKDANDQASSARLATAPTQAFSPTELGTLGNEESPLPLAQSRPQDDEDGLTGDS
jgi:hypothetical protein